MNQIPAPNIKNESNFICADIKIIFFNAVLRKFMKTRIEFVFIRQIVYFKCMEFVPLLLEKIFHFIDKENLPENHMKTAGVKLTYDNISLYQVIAALIQINRWFSVICNSKLMGKQTTPRKISRFEPKHFTFCNTKRNTCGVLECIVLKTLTVFMKIALMKVIIQRRQCLHGEKNCKKFEIYHISYI